MPRIVRLRHGRLAIRTTAPNGETLLLAVPPMHPNTPREVRAQVFEYTLRRQVGLAQMLADFTADSLDGIEGARARLASLMGETPHKNRRGLGAAA